MPIKLEIVMNEDGRVQVTGPIDNKDLAYRILFEAFLAITHYEAKKIVQPAFVPPLNPLKGGKG